MPSALTGGCPQTPMLHTPRGPRERSTPRPPPAPPRCAAAGPAPGTRSPSPRLLLPRRCRLLVGSVFGVGVGSGGVGARGFDLAWAPALVEERLERAVEAQDHEPAPVGVGLDPVALRA